MSRFLTRSPLATLRQRRSASVSNPRVCWVLLLALSGLATNSVLPATEVDSANPAGSIGHNVTNPAQQTWEVPIAGNHFRTTPEPGGGRVGREGVLSWTQPDEVYAIYFHVDRPATVDLALEFASTPEAGRLRVSVGDTVRELTVGGDTTAQRLGEPVEIGQIEVAAAGYVRLDLQGIDRTGRSYPGVKTLRVTSATPDLQVHYVRDNEGNMFYWGRRGPSVHLTYRVPRDLQVEYAYSEITVPEGEDPLGSYYMANGFGEGYFGIQVNSPTERRVLFSVWSPFQTDNPQDIPADQRIEALARGPEVRIGEFGNEGSGGQSFLVYPWQAGRTYQFLTRVVPDGAGNTVYTAWFGDATQAEPWRLIASFKRPKTDTHLRGFHSFLESFNPATGHLHRRSRHHNVWVRDVGGQWHRCPAARFSVDATGGGGHRLDFGGGVDGDGWFMENCGFFSGQIKAGTQFELPASPQPLPAPAIDFDQLPK